MPKSGLGEVLRFLQKACALQGTCDLSDRELFERFLSHRDEGAFTFLVRRHGPMILGIGRRVLGDAHEAEDVSQATFLVLARRTRAIGGKQSVGGWLHGVARHIALKASAQKAARRLREKAAETMRSERPVDDLSMRELHSVLDEEIAALPEKYRGPIILCCLENKTHDEAAQELGCPRTSLTSRLNRARELLRRKLERRGITLAIGALATSLAEMAAAAPLPASLTIKTVKAAALVAGGKAVAGGCISAQVLALAEEAARGILWVKAKLILMVVGFGLAVGGAGWVGYSGLVAKGQPGQGVVAQTPAPKKQAEVPADEEKVVGKDLYGDPLPEGAVARLGTLRFRHEGQPRALAFTPDGKTLLCSTNSETHVWDSATGKERLRIPVSISYYEGMDISPDGTTLAVPVQPGKVIKITLWDLHTGKKTQSLELPNGEGSLAKYAHLRFTPDGKGLACNSKNGKTIIFDLASGNVNASFGGRDSQVFYHHAFSPDGKTLAAVVQSDDPKKDKPYNGVQLWDMATGKLIRSIHDFGEIKNETLIKTIAFTPDGKRLAFGTSKSFFLADLETGKIVNQLEASGDQALAPDGNTLVSLGKGAGYIVRKVATGKILSNINKNSSYFGTMALSPDGKIIAVGTWSSVRLWDVATGKELLTEYQGHNSEIRDLAFLPDGKTLVSSAWGDQIFLWDTRSQRRSVSLHGSARAMAVSPDGKQLATSDPDYVGNKSYKVRIWDLADRKEKLAITVPDAEGVESIQFSSDGRRLYTMDWKSLPRNGPGGLIEGSPLENMHLRKWNLATGLQEQMWTIPSSRLLLPLASDGKTIIMPNDDGSIIVHDAKSGISRLLPSLGKGFAGSFSLSPDARVLATGMARPTSAKDMQDGINGVVPATGMAGPSSAIRLWEVVTGKEIVLLKVQENSLPSVAWSPGGRLLASVSAPGYMRNNSEGPTVRLWDTATGKELARFGGFKSFVSTGAFKQPVVFSPDGKTLAAGFSDSTILLWDVSKYDPKVGFGPKLGKDQLESLWADLANDNPGKAHQAIWSLIDSPRDSVAFLHNLLKPALLADQGKIEKWIADLDSEKFPVRQAAAKELEKVGDQIQPPIQKALKANPSLETRRRLEQILKNLPDVPDPETVRTVRAIMALERIGSPEARSVLEVLANGAPGSRETEEARGSLERLVQRASLNK